MSEHDLREGSEPEVNERLQEIKERHSRTYWHEGEYFDARQGEAYLLSQLAAILEENQRLVSLLNDAGVGHASTLGERVQFLINWKNANEYAATHQQAENQRLRGTFCEAHAAEDCKSCPCCEAVHQDDLREAAEAENQRLAKKLDEAADNFRLIRESLEVNETLHCSTILHSARTVVKKMQEYKAAEAKLGKMREALETIAEWPFDIMGDCVKDATELARAALAE